MKRKGSEKDVDKSDQCRVPGSADSEPVSSAGI